MTQVIVERELDTAIRAVSKHRKTITVSVSERYGRFSSHKKYEVEVNLIEKYNALSKTFSPTSNINDISF